MLGGSVGPEHSREFLHPFAFSFVHTFTQVVEDGAIADFSLAIILKIIRYGELMCDLVLDTEAGYLLPGKLMSEIIVWGSQK